MNPTKEQIWDQKKQIVQQYLADPRYSGGRDRLFANIKPAHPDISRRDVARVLAEDEVHQQHRSLNKRITSRPIIINGPARASQVDLIDVQGEKTKNDRTRYLLTYVDLFSKYCAVRPLKDKTTRSVIAGLSDILDSMPSSWRPTLIQSDNGAEMKRQFETALHERGIKTIHSAAYSPQTQGAIERFNRTLKSALFEQMTRHNTRRYIDFVQPLVDNINNTKHGTTGFKPIDIMQAMPLDQRAIDLIHERMRKKIKRSTQSDKTFAVDDYVRVAVTTESAIRKTEKFRKKISINWSSVIFQVYAVSDPINAGTQPQYLLKNLTTGRKSKKRYFGYQLQPAAGYQQVSDPGPVGSVDDSVEEDPPADSGDADEVVPAASQPRRSVRAWVPSAAALQNLAR